MIGLEGANQKKDRYVFPLLLNSEIFCWLSSNEVFCLERSNEVCNESNEVCIESTEVCNESNEDCNESNEACNESNEVCSFALVTKRTKRSLFLCTNKLSPNFPQRNTTR